MGDYLTKEIPMELPELVDQEAGAKDKRDVNSNTKILCGTLLYVLLD